ncbi:MAG TPA: iron-binding protein [Gammaproteobacteria bacterium]|jgi:CDGSH-type Zn-finger protein|nr:iron-binding protein [Gammaproteobacteria bacterium]
MVTIKVRRNGPYRVDGKDVTLVDWTGKQCSVSSDQFALCRCGASQTKPFCDKSHQRVGFSADPQHPKNET